MVDKNRDNTYNTLFYWHNFQLKIVGEGIIIGLIVGFIIVFYRYLLEKSSILLDSVRTMSVERAWVIPAWFLILILVGYIVGLMVKKEPMISGSGIPQVEGVILRQLDMNWFRVIIGKFIGGVLCIGSGLSLGREGPSVQIGASVGEGFSRLFKRVKIEEKYLITSGASAGLAAAFGAPLAGVIFALEEVHKNFSPFILTSAMAASLTADFVLKNFFGFNPVFNFQGLQMLPLRYYFYLIILGVIIGLGGKLFNVSLLKTMDRYDEIKIPNEYKIIIPLIIAGVLCFVLPQVLGGGHSLIHELIISKYTLGVLIILLIIKFGFTMVCYGSGAPGGIFLPLLVIGAIVGAIYGNVLVNIFHIDSVYIMNFIVLAMAGYFTAIVKAPITGSILITEMTGSFQHLLALTTVSITAYIVTDIINSKPVYELLLERMLSKKDNKFIGDNNKKVVLEMPVCIGTRYDGKLVKDINWPSYCLLVGIKRGKTEIIPKGETRIYAGDYLIVLTNEDEANRARIILEKMSEDEF